MYRINFLLTIVVLALTLGVGQNTVQARMSVNQEPRVSTHNKSPFLDVSRGEGLGAPTVVTSAEMYLAPVNGPNLMGEVTPPDKSTAIALIKPTEEYLVPVSGPNLTGKIPPLDKSKAIPLHQANGFTPNEVVGQWYMFVSAPFPHIWGSGVLGL